MLKTLAILLATWLLAGCATVNYADGERVAIRHDGLRVDEIQGKADQACLQSGGHAPAKFVSNVSANPSLPDAITAKIATFRCATR